MPIKIETIAADEEKQTFIVNSDIWIRYTDIDESMEAGNLNAEVDYNETKYSQEDIQQVIYDLFVEIVDSYIEKNPQPNTKETDEIQP